MPKQTKAFLFTARFNEDKSSINLQTFPSKDEYVNTNLTNFIFNCSYVPGGDVLNVTGKQPFIPTDINAASTEILIFMALKTCNFYVYEDHLINIIINIRYLMARKTSQLICRYKCS
ncbi:unnamed protein product [Dicrocoelium dendriticum]|nr:unnamed protein product [Dicrocoelium dendriticum]